MDKITEILESIKNHESIAIKPVTKTKEEITLELLAHFSDIDIDSLSKGNLKKDDWPTIIAASGKLFRLDLHFIEGEEAIDSKQYRVIQF
jgi:replicative DNA helicase